MRIIKMIRHNFQLILIIQLVENVRVFAFGFQNLKNESGFGNENFHVIIFWITTN